MKHWYSIIFVMIIALIATFSIAAADTYYTHRFLHVKLDSKFIDNQIWEFHGTNDKGHDFACVNGFKYDNNYVCGIFLTGETGGFLDRQDIIWAKPNEVLKKSGTSIDSDLGDYYDCSGAATCDTSPCGNEGTNSVIPEVVSVHYSAGWVDSCGLTCELSKSNTEYRPAYDILCNKEPDGTGKWYVCEGASSCLNGWACNAGAGTWTKCSSPTPKCFSGSCVECLSNADCTSDPARPVCQLSTHTCTTPAVCKCKDNSRCDFCSITTPGAWCDGSTGTGVLQENNQNCDAGKCVKYNILAGIKVAGVSELTPDICLYNYDPVTKKYNYMLDAPAGGTFIKETKCQEGTCTWVDVDCTTNPLYGVVKAKVEASKIPENIINILPNSESYYCNNYQYMGSESGSTPPTPACNNNGIQDNGETGKDCGGGGCPTCDTCAPGNPPYQLDGTANCAKCSCPPSEYPGATVSCNGVTGLCSYAAPPGLPGEPPDCPISGPESATYTKTYPLTTLYLLSGDNTGGFSGYKFDGSWQSDANIKSGLSTSSYASPAVFFNNSNTFLITGKGDGTFSGYNWTGTSWSSLPAIVSGLPDVGDNSKPAIFYKDGKWNLLAGNKTGNYSGFTFTGSNWVSNKSIVAGLPNETCNAAPSVFYSGAMYLVSGNCTGGFIGYYWNGTQWLDDAYIVSGLANVAANSTPYAFYNNSILYLITGQNNGNFAGYSWNGTEWRPDASITTGLAAVNSQSSPAIFSIDSTYTKTFTYSTRFPLESMIEYPSAGSQCFQNKTTITIPEGHACQINLYANSTHGWGVRLKSTITPGKTLQQDPFNTCGYINDEAYSSCHPTGFGGMSVCPINQTPVLQAGTYEFGIVSSTAVANNKVSKACGFITQCADCENPYAEYYCDLCLKDICNDNLQDCGEAGIDCGGTCASGSETTNSYAPTMWYDEPSGLSDTILFTDSVAGLNCVDGIDNDKDCKTDCADSDCAASMVCSIDITPPATFIELNPSTPNAKGWFTEPVKATLRCEDTQSGCASTKYRIDGSDWITISYAQPSFILSSDGAHLLEYYSTDKRGNTEDTQSSTVKVYISPPLSLIISPSEVTIPLGAQGQALVTVKNLLDRPDDIIISIAGAPSHLHKWIWFGGHRDDSSKYLLTLQLQAGEEKIVPVTIFGGEVLLGGTISITAESSYIGVVKSGTINVDIAHSEDGLTVQTPEFGWVAFVLIALLAALLI